MMPSRVPHSDSGPHYQLPLLPLSPRALLLLTVLLAAGLPRACSDTSAPARTWEARPALPRSWDVFNRQRELTLPRPAAAPTSTSSTYV